MAEIVTNIGRRWIAELICGLRDPQILYQAWGTGGSTDAKVTDTALVTEKDRDAATASLSASNAQLPKFYNQWTMTESISPSEQGLFDAAVGGNLIFRRGNLGHSMSVDDVLTFSIFLWVDYYLSGSRDWMDGNITTVGHTGISSRLINSSPEDPFTVFGFGTGTTAENDADTALVTEVERVTATFELISKLAFHDTIRYRGVFSPVSSETVIAEIGIFNALTSGTLLWRDVLASTITIPNGVVPELYAEITIASEN